MVRAGRASRSALVTNGCDAAFRIARRAASPEQSWQETVSAQRTCYDTRDQTKLAQGESNVRSVTCTRVRYALADGRVRRLDWRERDGACTAAMAKETGLPWHHGAEVFGDAR